jgi:hypothetical protein
MLIYIALRTPDVSSICMLCTTKVNITIVQNSKSLEMCALFAYYAASNGNLLPTFRDNLSIPSSRVKKSKLCDFLTLEDGTDTLSRKVGAELPLDTV